MAARASQLATPGNVGDRRPASLGNNMTCALLRPRLVPRGHSPFANYSLRLPLRELLPLRPLSHGPPRIVGDVGIAPSAVEPPRSLGCEPASAKPADVEEAFRLSSTSRPWRCAATRRRPTLRVLRAACPVTRLIELFVMPSYGSPIQTISRKPSVQPLLIVCCGIAPALDHCLMMGAGHGLRVYPRARAISAHPSRDRTHPRESPAPRR